MDQDDLPAATSSAVPFAGAEICAEAREAALRVLESGRLTTGPETLLFEREFASCVDARHAVAVSSCTAGLELALRALHLTPGETVLLPALTFCGAAQAVLHAGLSPLLVDVEPETAMPSRRTVTAALRGRPRPAAMMVLHYGGAPAPLAELADAAGLPLQRLVEDAAHALGTHIQGRPVGALSRAAVFSFHGNDDLPLGEGGMVTTDDEALAERVRRGRLHGMTVAAWQRVRPVGRWSYTVDEPGLKANMTDLQAAIGRAQLRHLGTRHLHRTALAARYAQLLACLPGVEPLPLPDEGGRHGWHLYAVRLLPAFGPSRDAVAEGLAERGIGTSVHFVPLHWMAGFRDAALVPSGGLPGTEAVFPQLLSLPLHPGLCEEQVDQVCAALAELAGLRVPATESR